MKIEVVLCKTATEQEVAFFYDSYLRIINPYKLQLVEERARTVLYSGDKVVSYHISTTNYDTSNLLHRTSAWTDFVRRSLKISELHNDPNLSVVDFDKFRVGIFEVTTKGSKLLGYKYPINVGKRLSYSREKIPQPRIARSCSLHILYTKGFLNEQPFGYAFQSNYQNKKTFDVSQVVFLDDGYTHRWKAIVDLTKKRGYAALEEDTYVTQDRDADSYEV